MNSKAKKPSVHNELAALFTMSALVPDPSPACAVNCKTSNLFQKPVNNFYI
jgi:hypothetical protein